MMACLTGYLISFHLIFSLSLSLLPLFLIITLSISLVSFFHIFTPPCPLHYFNSIINFNFLFPHRFFLLFFRFSYFLIVGSFPFRPQTLDLSDSRHNVSPTLIPHLLSSPLLFSPFLSSTPHRLEIKWSGVVWCAVW